MVKKVRSMDYQHKNNQIKKEEDYAEKQVSCTLITTALYHLASGFLSSIVTPLIDIITATDLHLFCSLLLSPSLFL